MPRYMVTGADAETAEDRAIELDAPDAEEAARLAVEAGMLVHRVYPISGERLAAAAGVAADLSARAARAMEASDQRWRERDQDRAAQSEARRRQREKGRVGLRPDWPTISAIANGVLLGLICFCLLSCLLSMLVPGLIAAAAGAAGAAAGR